jgi:hypothetical protein
LSFVGVSIDRSVAFFKAGESGMLDLEAEGTAILQNVGNFNSRHGVKSQNILIFPNTAVVTQYLDS